MNPEGVNSLWYQKKKKRGHIIKCIRSCEKFTLFVFFPKKKHKGKRDILICCDEISLHIYTPVLLDQEPCWCVYGLFPAVHHRVACDVQNDFSCCFMLSCSYSSSKIMGYCNSCSILIISSQRIQFCEYSTCISNVIMLDC